MRFLRIPSRQVVAAAFLFLTLIAWHAHALAGQLTLTWVDNSTGELGFSIERSTESAGSFSEIATTGSGVTTYTDVTVADGTTYCYRVRGFYSTGYSLYSNSACASFVPTLGLAVVKIGAGSGTVTSAPAGIVCGASCSASYASGTVVTLTAAAAAGSTFTGWSGAGCSGTGTCTVTVTAATTVTATFAVLSTGSPSSLSVTPGSVIFTKVVGQPNPPQQAVTVTAAAGQVWTTHDTMPFADVTGAPFNGVDGVNGTGTVTLQVVPSSGMNNLAVGVYTGSIRVSSAGVADSVISVLVNVVESCPTGC